MKDKIFLIGPTESVLTKRGNRFPNIADYLIQKGVNICYITSDFYHAEKRFFTREEKQQAKSNCSCYELKIIKVLGYNANISARRVFSNLFFSIAVFFYLLFKLKRGDKILLPSRPVELIFFISLIKRLKKVHIYLDIQDIWPDALKIESKRKKKLFEAYCNFYLYPSLKHYTNTFHVAPSFYQCWLKRYAPDTPSVFIPLGWENKRWEKIDKKKPHNINKILKLVCVAQLQHQIDVMPILEVLNYNKKLHLTIIGEDGRGERYHEVKKYIEENKIENVKIIGKVERNEMVTLLWDKDIGILPMITSSIPNKIFDYMAAILPIIVLGDNDSAEFVTKNEIGWSCGFNSVELGKILNNINKGEILNKRNKLMEIRDNFSRDQLHKKIEKTIL